VKYLFILFFSLRPYHLILATETDSIKDCIGNQMKGARTNQVICNSDQIFYSKSCKEPPLCPLLKSLKKLALKDSLSSLISETGSPTYRLCYKLEGRPLPVIFVKKNSTSKRLICLLENGDFMEADELLKIFSLYSSSSGE
jgi:hypothetical protein